MSVSLAHLRIIKNNTFLCLMCMICDLFYADTGLESLVRPRQTGRSAVSTYTCFAAAAIIPFMLKHIAAQLT